MAITKKDPGKVGYLTTEFQAMVAYGLYTLFGKFGSGASPGEINASFSSFLESISSLLGDDPISSVLLGIIILYYTKSRTKVKTAEIKVSGIKIGANEEQL